MPSFFEGLVQKMKVFHLTAHDMRQVRTEISDIHWLMGQTYLKELSKEPRYQDPKRLLSFGRKMFSQNDEDGTITEIFNRIGTRTKFFVEIGVQSGHECNTRALLLQNWRGAWIEASEKYLRMMRPAFAAEIATKQLEVVPEFVTREYAKNELMKRWPALEDVDLFSIDIDGIDYHIVEAMGALRARVIVVEYNAKYYPPFDWVMTYDEHFWWNGSEYFGASLTAWNRLLSDRGYVLVGCGVVGVNAFFVRKDLVNDKFCEPFTPENHYEPARYWTGAFRSGHP